jgi:hypothetical protein
VIAIRDNAFSNYGGSLISIINLNLTNASNLISIGDSAFYNQYDFMGSLTIPNSVTSIGGSAFESCTGFTSLVIGDSVTSIDSFAFAFCDQMTGTLTIPQSVVTLDENNPFYKTPFTDIVNYSPSFTFADNVGSAKVLIPASSGTSLDYDDTPNYGCIAFGQLTIPSGVTSIGNALFMGSRLTGSLTIPNSVTSIGDYAFYQCSGLTGSLTIPDSITSIGDDLFSGCSGLTGSLIIPDSVTSIGESAFGSCTGFTSLVIGNLVTDIGINAFAYCSGCTGSLTIPNSVTSIGHYAFFDCSGFDTIDVST